MQYAFYRDYRLIRVFLEEGSCFFFGALNDLKDLTFLTDFQWLIVLIASTMGHDFNATVTNRVISGESL